jgi:hypothetical protein
MNIVNTIAPISIEDLKKYFTDKTITYIIDYTNSTIKGKKLLTYLSNLDIPCDIRFTTKEEEEELLKEYLHFEMICNIPELEKCTIHLLLEQKGLVSVPIYQIFSEHNKKIIKTWTEKLDSLIVYNAYTVNNHIFKNYVKQFPIDETDDITGINFVSLLKHEEFYDFYIETDEKNLKFYKNYFEKYMFKGKNLFSYWADPINPMFILTWGTTSDVGKETIKEMIKETKGEPDVTSV